MKRLNVMMLTPWYPTQGYKYAGVFVREYAKAVLLHSNVTVLHCGIVDQTIPKWWAVVQEHDKDLTDGIPSYRVLFRPSRIKGGSFLRYIGSVYRAAIEVSRAQGRPDLIHAHVYVSGWPALLIGKRLRVPVLISEHFSGFSRDLLSRGQLCQARLIFRLAHAVLPVSHMLQTTLQKKRVLAAFQVVPQVVDTELFFYRAQRFLQNGSLRLLAVSSLIEVKGLAHLFQALTMVPWNGRVWHLDVVGDGPEAEEHYRMVKDLGLSANVTFHGQMLKSEVALMMRTANLFVLPSLIETFSAATAEALASGLPVLATRCGGPEGFVTEQQGMLVSPGSPEELSEALTIMIDRLPSYDRAGIAQEAKERFASARVGAMLYELYNRLLERRSQSSA